jgi:hypothetical protein
MDWEVVDLFQYLWIQLALHTGQRCTKIRRRVVASYVRVVRGALLKALMKDQEVKFELKNPKGPWGTNLPTLLVLTLTTPLI